MLLQRVEATSHALGPSGLEVGDRDPLGGLWPRPGWGRGLPRLRGEDWAILVGERFSLSLLWVLGQEAGSGVPWWPCGPSVAANVGGQRIS